MLSHCAARGGGGGLGYLPTAHPPGVGLPQVLTGGLLLPTTL